ARLFGETTRRLEALAPFDRRRSGNHQLPSRRPSRHATFNQRNHTLTQIKGIASRHPAPPDSEGNADSPISTPKGIPQSSRFRPSGECSNPPLGGGWLASLASFRRFCAMAASVNSSLAPQGPRNRSLLSLRMRLRCANSISIFFRSRRDRKYSGVPARCRTTSRAASWMLLGILRWGWPGQHFSLSAQASQSLWLAR